MPERIIARIAVERGYALFDLDAALEADQRKQRLSHPAGRFDQAGVFHLEEHCDCCVGLQSASIARPYTEMHHARSLIHLAHLYDVPVLHLRRLVKVIELGRKFPLDTVHAQGQFTVLVKNILRPVIPSH